MMKIFSNILNSVYEIFFQVSERLTEGATYVRQATAPSLFPVEASRAAVYLTLVAVLVALVLVGGFFAIRLGMMAKREDDGMDLQLTDLPVGQTGQAGQPGLPSRPKLPGENVKVA